MVELQELTDADREAVLGIVTAHAELTGSPLARGIADGWHVEAERFKRVMPVDYERVLRVIELAEAEGLGEQATLDRVMEASRG